MSPQYEKIFNNMHQFTGLLEPDGTLLKANDSALKFGGLDRAEVIGKKIWKTYWFRVSKDTQRQTRADVQRAADGESVRHDITVQGENQTAVIDFSIRPLTDDDGEVKRLLAEGRDIPAPNLTELLAEHSDDNWPGLSLLVVYSRDADESMSEAILHAFLAINVDVFGRTDVLEEWIETDHLDGFEWRSERPLSIATRVWDYTVVMTADEVRIYTDSSQLE